MVMYCLKCSKKQKHMRFAKTNKRNLLLLGYTLFQRYKPNEIGNKFLLAGDTFMSDTHLKQQDVHTVLMDNLLKI